MPFGRCGGIGRHAVLRGQWRELCRFESGHRHQYLIFSVTNNNGLKLL